MNKTAQGLGVLVFLILHLVWLGAEAWADVSERDHRPSAPADIQRLLDSVSAPEASASSRVQATSKFLQAIHLWPSLPDTLTGKLYDAAKSLIRADDTALVASSSKLLDVWSMSLMGEESGRPFLNNPAQSAEALGWCVTRQGYDTNTGGSHFRRILYRHAWNRDALSDLGVSERRMWLNNMIDSIHSDRSVVEPFFLAVLWSLPPAERLTAVNALSRHLTASSSRLLIALTLYTLVPMPAVDAARDYLAQHGMNKEILRDLSAEIGNLRIGDSEEALYLKDALRIGLRSYHLNERAAALRRSGILLESSLFPSELQKELEASIAAVFKKQMFPGFALGYWNLVGLYDQSLIPFSIFRSYLATALQYNPFDTEKGARFIDLRNSRTKWLIFMGKFVGNQELSRKERMEVLRSLMEVPLDERYEDTLREAIQPAVKAGLLGPADYAAWLKKRTGGG